MTRPNVEGWDDEAQAFWDEASPTEKAATLEDFAMKVLPPGNARSHMLAAARYIALSDGWQEPEHDAAERRGAFCDCRPGGEPHRLEDHHQED